MCKSTLRLDPGLVRAGLVVLMLAMAACASRAPDVAPVDTSKGDRAAASQLYAGQPAVVHATEYPVASAAEGIQRGDEAWRQGKLDLAVYLYVQSLAFDASKPDPFLKIGTIHELLGNPALAATAYELALQRGGDSAAACERLGLLYVQAGRNDEAAALFERALAQEPKRWRSLNGLGLLAERRKDYAGAIVNYDRALEAEPRAATVLTNRGLAR